MSFKKGKLNINWKGGKPNCLDCGKKLASRQSKRCNSCGQKGKNNSGKGKNSHKWKGENARYETKHQWLYNNFGQPNFCEACGADNASIFDWANISGEYKRDKKDWIRLCRMCHWKYDNKTKLYSYMGIQDGLTNWSKYFGIKRSTLYMRVEKYNWDMGKALHTSVEGGN